MVRVVGSQCRAVVPHGCDRCAGDATYAEMIVDGRLHWSVSHSCTAEPPGHSEDCGRDDPPAELRRALLEQCGEYRLRVDGQSDRGAVMKVLRERLATPLPEMSALVATLAGAGLGGTEMELRLLAQQFTEAGVSALVQRPT
ncbi:hypothetical protein Ait01nite_095050 [Actinoplanes italicus]|uniref:Uncharacterized protein n=1 Tax=Actinoplanes italicus TaxID=113567 RepID=A0A2T0K2D8_9ACTN|nr:hypothetical protein [Actinoplanes italicus]PRX16982.1 hypothetical protein CLV67_11738 [Actinoplanes italicus]GIE36460.1 hypothetical protein Ait01nite_095050 [Actinoplanes italicus]